MQRRSFLKKGSLASVSIIARSASVQASEEKNRLVENPFNLNYAIHDGMFANHGGKDFIDQIKFAHDQGFRSIEDNGMMTRTPQEQERIGKTLDTLGMQMGVFVITSDSWHWKISLASGKPEWTEKMVKDCREAVDVAKRCRAKWMTVVPGNFERSLPEDIQTANIINALRRGTEILQANGLVMVLEPLSDNPDLFLRHSTQTYMICEAVNSPACKI